MAKIEIYSISLVIRQGFSSQNSTRNSDPLHKMKPDLWDCFGRDKRWILIFGIVLEANFDKTDLDIQGSSRQGNAQGPVVQN